MIKVAFKKSTVNYILEQRWEYFVMLVAGHSWKGYIGHENVRCLVGLSAFLFYYCCGRLGAEADLAYTFPFLFCSFRLLRFGFPRTFFTVVLF